MNKQNVSITVDTLNNKILAVFDSVDKAKQAWQLSYHKKGFVHFQEQMHGIINVYHPLDKQCLIGWIQTYELWTEPQHL